MNRYTAVLSGGAHVFSVYAPNMAMARELFELQTSRSLRRRYLYELWLDQGAKIKCTNKRTRARSGS